MVLASRDVANVLWTRTILYRDDYSINGQITVQLANNATFMLGTIAPSSSTKYIRLSARVWNGTNIALVEKTKIEEWLQENIDFEVVARQ